MGFSATTALKILRASVLTVSGLIVLLPTPPANACLCGGSLNQDEAIFKGKVIAREEYDAIAQVPGNDSILWTFAVDTVTKGKVVNQEKVMVGSNDCEFRFDLGRRYQVYAGRFQGILATSRCSWTKQLDLPDAPDSSAQPQPPANSPGCQEFFQPE